MVSYSATWIALLRADWPKSRAVRVFLSIEARGGRVLHGLVFCRRSRAGVGFLVVDNALQPLRDVDELVPGPRVWAVPIRTRKARPVESAASRRPSPFGGELMQPDDDAQYG